MVLHYHVGETIFFLCSHSHIIDIVLYMLMFLTLLETIALFKLILWMKSQLWVQKDTGVQGKPSRWKLYFFSLNVVFLAVYLWSPPVSNACMLLRSSVLTDGPVFPGAEHELLSRREILERMKHPEVLNADPEKDDLMVKLNHKKYAHVTPETISSLCPKLYHPTLENAIVHLVGSQGWDLCGRFSVGKWRKNAASSSAIDNGTVAKCIALQSYIRHSLREAQCDIPAWYPSAWLSHFFLHVVNRGVNWVNILSSVNVSDDQGLGMICSVIVNANRKTFGWSLFDVLEAAKIDNSISKQPTHSIFDVPETVRHGLVVAGFHAEQYICQHQYPGDWWLEFKKVFASK